MLSDATPILNRLKLKVDPCSNRRRLILCLAVAFFGVEQ